MSDDLEILKQRVAVLDIATRNASLGAIKNPLEYAEQLWNWVSPPKRQPQVETPAISKRGRPKKAG